MCVLLVVGDCVGARKKGNHQHKDWSHPSYEYIIPFSEHTHNIYFIHENSCFIAEHEQPFSNHYFPCICFALFHAVHVKKCSLLNSIKSNLLFVHYQLRWICKGFFSLLKLFLFLPSKIFSSLDFLHPKGDCLFAAPWGHYSHRKYKSSMARIGWENVYVIPLINRICFCFDLFF